MSAASTPQPAVPTLVPEGAHAGERPMTLNRLFTLIGSAPSARLYLPSKAVSRCHAVVINADTGLFVRDLASRTQVLVNGRPVKEADLREGDVVQIGPFTFRFTHPGAKGPASPAEAATKLPKAGLQADGLDEPLPVEERVVLIGRREAADVSLTENSASSAHAVIVATGGAHVLRDLNSRTGTFVNGVKVHEHALSPGDVIRVGETTLRYVRAAGQPPKPAAPPEVKPVHAAPAEPELEPESKHQPEPASLSKPAPAPETRSAPAHEPAHDPELVVEDPADLPVERVTAAEAAPREPDEFDLVLGVLDGAEADNADERPVDATGGPALDPPMDLERLPVDEPEAEPMGPEAARPGAVSSEIVRSEPVRGEPARAEPMRVEPARPEPAPSKPAAVPPAAASRPAPPPAPPPPPTPPKSAAPGRSAPAAKAAPPPKAAPPRRSRPRSPFDLVSSGSEVDPLADLLATDRKSDPRADDAGRGGGAPSKS